MAVGITIAIIAAIALIIAFIFASYVKAAPDTALIISGARKKVVIGKAAFRIPFFERIDRLPLQLVSIDVKTSSSVPTADYINIKADAVVNIKISDKPELLSLAAQNFLNKDTNYISGVAREVLEGNMREIIGRMKLQDMVSDRQQFANLVKENAVPDLEAMGLEIIAFNVQNFIDGNGVIENLGVDNISQISKTAAIAKANADKEVAIAQADAHKIANDARVAAQTEIETKNNELKIKQAELKKESDARIAEAEAVKGIKDEEQRQLREIAAANANLARQEKEIELQAKAVEIEERRLEADIKKKAEADKYAAQQKADAELYKIQKSAEAELFQRTKQAEAQATEEQKAADMKRYTAEQDAAAKKAMAEAIEAEGKAVAEAARAKGEAEAEAIRLKALAEAEGLDKKAEAMKKYGEAAMADMQMQVAKAYVEQLPSIAKAVGEGYQGVDKIVMLGDDSGKLAGNIMNTTTQISEGLSQSLGIDLKTLLAGVIGGKIASNGDNN